MNKFYKLVLSAIIAGFSLTSCNKDDNKPEEAKGAFENGIFVSNEGAFGVDNASVSFIDIDGKVQQNIFKTVNGRGLGNTLQSMLVANENAYLVLNGSNKVEVVDANTFKVEGVITDLKSPRYIAQRETKIYISQWGNKSVGVYDAITLNLDATVLVGNGPEGLLVINKELWVANSGGYGQDNTISIIDTEENTVTETIDLPGDNPKTMLVDFDGDVWVLCAGYTDWSTGSKTDSKLIEIDYATKTIKNEIVLSTTIQFDRLGMSYDRKTIYYGGGYGGPGIFKMETSSSEVPTTPFIAGNFYGFNIDANNGVYATVVTADWKSNGKVVKYSATGSELKTYEAGIGPNGVTFNL